MTTQEARGNRSDVQDMSLMTGKYSATGILFLVVPLLIETRGILELWLVDVPPYAVLFVQLTMISQTLAVLTSGLDRAVYAHGNIRAYALASCGLWAATLAAGALCIFTLGLPPWTVPLCTLAGIGLLTPLRIRIAGGPIDVGPARWLRETVGPLVAPMGAGLLCGVLVSLALDDGPIRYLAVTTAYAAVAAPLSWWVTVSPREKTVLRNIVTSRLSRVAAA